VNAEIRTALLGRFERLEEEIVLEILAEHGIYAIPKNDPRESSHSDFYGQGFSVHGEILVDARRLADARALIDQELPKHLAAIAESMEAMETDEE
jgi:hypothetical protein